MSSFLAQAATSLYGLSSVGNDDEHIDMEYRYDDDEDEDDDDEGHLLSRQEQFESSIVHPTMNYQVGNKTATSSSSSSSASTTVMTLSERIKNGWIPEEGIGTCFSQYALSCRHVATDNNNQSDNKMIDPIARFRTFALSNDFKQFIQDAGMEFKSFEPNPYAAPDQRLYRRFHALLMGQSEGKNPSTTNNEAAVVSDQSCLAIVFHGTATGNVSSILQDGLDKNRRLGQAYGPGEYFSKDPSISVAYCKQGHEMLVFLVVVPPDDESRFPNKPDDYVVVNENTHQLPLGVLKFGEVDQAAMNRSQQRRTGLKKLCSELVKRETAVFESQTKAYIIQCFIQGKHDLAMEKYEKNHNLLHEDSKREISMYAHDALDRNVIAALMPNLPEPYSKLEFHDKADLKTVEAREKEAQSVKDQLDHARRGENGMSLFFTK